MGLGVALLEGELFEFLVNLFLLSGLGLHSCTSSFVELTSFYVVS